jgi:hypothetical protein
MKRFSLAIVSVVFLIIAFRGLNPAAVLDRLAVAQWWLVVLAAGIYLPAMMLISARWKSLLVNGQTIIRLFRLVAIGYMGNNIYPLRAGDVLRVGLLHKRFGVPVASGAASVLIERCLDGLVMLSFLLVSALFIELQSDLIGQLATLAAPAFIGAFIVFLALAQRPEALGALIHRLPAALAGKLNAIAHDIIAGLGALKKPRDLLAAVGFSYASWLVEALVYWLVAAALGLSVNYALIIMVLGAVNLGGLIPASPGGVGVFQFLASSVLIDAGVGADQALAFALVVHAVIWLVPTLLGAYFLPQMTPVGLEPTTN